MVEVREEINVQVMPPLHHRGPVFYACLPQNAETSREPGASGEQAKRRLASVLWDYLMARDASHWQRYRSSDSAAFPIQLMHDPLGKPCLLLGSHRGPTISFSEGGGKIWAALAGDMSGMGIDVADAAEFQGAYPFHRVFHAEEMRHVLHLTGGDLVRASALLWSVKEAVVKALGCAFHWVDPLQMHVQPSTEDRDETGSSEYNFPVRLSGKALERFPVSATQALWARSFPQAGMCLSIAVLNNAINAGALSDE